MTSTTPQPSVVDRDPPVDVLAELLADGPRDAADAQAEMDRRGFTEREIRAARETLGITRSSGTIFRTSFRGGWRWSLQEHRVCPTCRRPWPQTTEDGDSLDILATSSDREPDDFGASSAMVSARREPEATQDDGVRWCSVCGWPAMKRPNDRCIRPRCRGVYR
jgi:hypothetical protein